MRGALKRGLGEAEQLPDAKVKNCRWRFHNGLEHFS
jgi:hypothetical protein